MSSNIIKFINLKPKQQRKKEEDAKFQTDYCEWLW
jgi:hypothetical protein